MFEPDRDAPIHGPGRGPNSGPGRGPFDVPRAGPGAAQAGSAAGGDPARVAPRGAGLGRLATPEAEVLRRRLRAQFAAGRFGLAAVLRSAPGEAARLQFRLRLRSEFAAGNVAVPVGLGQGGDVRVGQGLRPVLAATRTGPPAAFRSRLRAQFVLGAVPLREAAELSAATAAGVAGPERIPAAPRRAVETAPSTHPPRPRLVRGSWVRSGVGALVAAAALLLFLLPAWRDPVWTLRPEADVTGVLFDHRPLPQGERELAAGTGRVLACGEEALRLALDDRALIQLGPEAQIRFCAPLRSLLGPIEAPVHLDLGLLDVHTLPGAERLELAIDTPNAVIDVDDASVSIVAKPTGTCIVVERGSVLVRSSRNGSAEPRLVSAGERYWVPRGEGSCAMSCDYVGADPDAAARLAALRAMLVDVEAGVF
jgi:hypothetical protein